MAVATPLHLTRRRIRGARRVMAAVLGILVLVLGPVASHYHEATQAHAVCEHGDEIHVDPTGSPSSAAADTAPAGRPSLADPTGWPASDDHDGHHHCTATAGAVATLAAQPAGAGATLVTGTVPATSSTGAVLTAALFRLAPKTSPPV